MGNTQFKLLWPPFEKAKCHLDIPSWIGALLPDRAETSGAQAAENVLHACHLCALHSSGACDPSGTMLSCPLQPDSHDLNIKFKIC